MKIARTLVPALLAAIAGAAHAQSSVTLYGTIDEGLDYISNVAGHSNYAMASNARQLGTRWGLTGSEDLGSGLHAVFRLENSFDLNSGQLSASGEMFGRQAYVGLSSDRAGTVTLGRQYDSVVDYVAPLSAAGSWGGGLFGHPFDADNLDETFRINNSVKFTSASYAGVQFGGLYGFSNQAGQFAGNRAWSLGARYAAGPLTAAAAYMDANGEDQNTSGAVVGSAYHAGTQRVAAAAVNYAIGSATLGVVYTHTALYGAPLPGFSALRNLTFDNVEVNAKYDLTPAWYVGMMYLYTHAGLHFQAVGANRINTHFNEIGATTGYHLSRRTEVYVQALYQRESGQQNASIAGLTDSSSHNQTVARVGLRTAF